LAEEVREVVKIERRLWNEFDVNDKSGDNKKQNTLVLFSYKLHGEEC